MCNHCCAATVNICTEAYLLSGTLVDATLMHRDRVQSQQCTLHFICDEQCLAINVAKTTTLENLYIPGSLAR